MLKYNKYWIYCIFYNQQQYLVDEHMRAIADAGLEASYDEQDLTGRGLFLGLKLNDS